MLLTDIELHELVDQGIITAQHSQVNGSSIDVTLHHLIRIESPNGLPDKPVDLKIKENIQTEELDLWLQNYPKLNLNGCYILRQDEFILASTNEFFNLPNDISAEYKLKSSMARNGLEHLNAGWCLVGDTEIPLLDGTSKPIKDLVGTNPWVYSLDKDGEFVPTQASRVWETKKVTKTIRVTLDNNMFFECTPEHKIMLRDGSYLEASKLDIGQSLMPLYRRDGQYGHEEIYCPSTILKGRWKTLKGRWRVTHRIVNEVINGKLPKGFDTHHIDHDKRNNSPSNLGKREKTDHLVHHNEIKNKSEKQRAIASKTMSSTNKAMWCDDEYRLKMKEKNKKNAAFLNNKRWGTPIPAEYLNHKVLKIEIKEYDTPIPVYDMTIPEYHNFALNVGVFVHNCDPTWHGSRLTLELKNVNRYHKLLIRPDMPIGQVVFFRGAPVREENSYAVNGKYNGQLKVTESKGIS